jgi:hypothetical protein
MRLNKNNADTSWTNIHTLSLDSSDGKNPVMFKSASSFPHLKQVTVHDCVRLEVIANSVFVGGQTTRQVPGKRDYVEGWLRRNNLVAPGLPHISFVSPQGDAEEFGAYMKRKGLVKSFAVVR